MFRSSCCGLGDTSKLQPCSNWPRLTPFAHAPACCLLNIPAQIADGYLVKYFASVTALLVYAAPLYFQPVAQRASQGELTRSYISSMRLLQNTSRCGPWGGEGP